MTTKVEIRFDQCTKDVIRQALIEYISARKCVRTDIDEGLQHYVSTRYAEQDEAFKVRKVQWLKPRIEAAYNVLEVINDTE